MAPGFFGSLFTGSRDWEIWFDNRAATFAKDGQQSITVPFEAITAVTARRGTIWAEIRIEFAAQAICCDGVVNNEAGQFIETLQLKLKVKQALVGATTRHEPDINQMAASLNRLLLQPKYLGLTTK